MRKIYFIAILTIASFQLSAQCNGRYQANIFTNVNVTTVQYGSNVDLGGNTINLMMDIYQPAGDSDQYRPLVLLAHGGSFTTGTKNDGDMVYMATELAKKGYVCASINYRLATSAFSLISEETTVKTVFNAIQDGKAAVRFFKQDAATTNTYKVNPNQIFFGGTSAGGILAINLAYIDDITDLSAQWQIWANQLGGIEGNSGNPGYCSRVNGTFGFAGGIADTAWIDPNDVPWYGSHSTGDQTVQYGYGQPLNGFTPVNLYGSGPIATRLNNVGTYNHLDTYSGADHPPFANSTTIMADNKDSLAAFLYNILDCNPNNLQKATQKNCANVTGIANINTTDKDMIIYPNPFNNEINVKLATVNDNTTIAIINSVGQIIIEQAATVSLNTISLSHLAKGVYFVRITTPKGTQTKLIIKH